MSWFDWLGPAVEGAVGGAGDALSGLSSGFDTLTGNVNGILGLGGDSGGLGGLNPGDAGSSVAPVSQETLSPLAGMSALSGVGPQSELQTSVLPYGQSSSLPFLSERGHEGYLGPNFGNPADHAAAVGTGADPTKSGGIGGFLKANSWLMPAGLVGAGIAKQALGPAMPGENALKGIAGQETANAKQLMAPLTTGSALPNGMQGTLDATKAANEAKIRQQYASMGLSGSTQEATALQQNEFATQQLYAQEATSLYNAGLRTMDMASGANAQLLANAMRQDQAMMSLMGQVAGATAKVSMTDALTPGDNPDNLFKLLGF